MCFWVVFRALSTSLALFNAPDDSSFDLFLISLCRRSRIGRTEPLRFFSVSRWVFTSPWLVLEKGNRYLVEEKYLSILSHVFKQPGNTTQTLVKMLTLFQWLVDSLNDQLALGLGALKKL